MELTQKTLTPAEKAAADYGIDLDLLDMQLELTPMQRMAAHQRAFELLQTLQQAGAHGRHQSASSASHSE